MHVARASVARPVVAKHVRVAVSKDDAVALLAEIEVLGIAGGDVAGENKVGAVVGLAVIEQNQILAR